MRKIISLLVFLVTLNLYGQENFGVFTGLNYSYLTDGFQKQINAEDSFGLQIGVLYNLKLSEKVSFRPKLSYSQQGDRIQTSQFDGSSFVDLSQIDSKLNYLNASLDFKFWNKIYIISGPQFGYLLKQKKLSFNSAYIQKDLDFGFNFGGGFEVHKLFFELGFYQGLTTLTNISKGFSESVLDVRNSLFKFTVGYNF